MSKFNIPHLYQWKAIVLGIVNSFFAFFLEPGMGKTVVILHIFKFLKNLGRTKGMLVVAPIRPMYQVWPKEVTKWTFSKGLKVEILHGPDKMSALCREADIYVINPQGLKWLFQTALKGKRNFPFDILVIDESGKFKNPSSKILKRVLAPKLHKFKRRYILNGSPAPDSYIDLWGQFLLVDLGKKFGTAITDFRNRYFKGTGFKGKVYVPHDDEARETILRRASHMCLVLRSKDYLDMPPFMENIIEVELPRKAMEVYVQIEKDLFTQIDEAPLEIKSAGVASMSCRQIASGALYKPVEEGQVPPPSDKREWFDLHTEKVDALVDLIEELQGNPLLIGYEFHHDLVRMRDALKKKLGIKLLHIGRGVSGKEASKIEDAWNKNKLRVLALHYSSAEGLNLQDSRCCDAVLFTPTWSLFTWEQWYQRVYRQGMQGSCFRLHYILARGTVDEVVKKRVEGKDKDQKNMKNMLIEYRKSS